MAPKNSPNQGQSSNGAAHGRSSGNAIRTIGPMIPLALALVHGAVTKKPTPPLAPAPIIITQAVQPAGTNTLSGLHCGDGTASSPPCVAPVPMLSKGHPVDWWFVFKLNSGAFPGCGGGDTRTCPFGGQKQVNAKYVHFGQQYLVASSESNGLAEGTKDCVGTTTDDPVGATFDEVYHGKYHYAVWNDQPYQDPPLQCGASDSCSAPWGHSKGMLAWNDAGEGFVMQVSTPSWPLSGNAASPRKTDGNTLGCVLDNDVEVSQHFFALRLNKADVVLVLQGLTNASVVTDPKDPTVVNNGGPSDVQDLVNGLGVKSSSTTTLTGVLSSGVELIGKPSQLHVPPWQLVSSMLGGVSLRTANWWVLKDAIFSTTTSTRMGCWDSSLEPPGAVEIAATGVWKGTTFGLKGGSNPQGNHAKIGVSTSGNDHFAIFGDENQEGSISGTDCGVSQNGRGGLFYVMNNETLSKSMTALIGGDTVPSK